jgi:hypothetical protein
VSAQREKTVRRNPSRRLTDVGRISLKMKVIG